MKIVKSVAVNYRYLYFFVKAVNAVDVFHLQFLRLQSRVYDSRAWNQANHYFRIKNKKSVLLFSRWLSN